MHLYLIGSIRIKLLPIKPSCLKELNLIEKQFLKDLDYDLYIEEYRMEDMVNNFCKNHT
ncbi:MAG: hypothetical protein KC505_10665 [Myxococcales bacterium]|nr:hypothetical protein [Myxococcales bacterium]